MLIYNENYKFWDFTKVAPKKSNSTPKIIHQLWIGDNPPLKLINTWKKNNPTWEHILWDETKLKQWKFKNQDKINSMKELNGKCDIIRYEILYHIGGFFVDCDTICLKSLKPELFEYECTSVYENERQRGGLIACGFMSAEPRCELMKLCIDNLKISQSPAWWYVGPAYFTHIVNKYKYPIKIMPSHYFIPRHYTGEVYQGNDNVYCDHLWGVTHPKGYQRFSKKNTIEKFIESRRDKIISDAMNCSKNSILNKFA